jgi:hypothetical protein
MVAVIAIYMMDLDVSSGHPANATYVVALEKNTVNY